MVYIYFYFPGKRQVAHRTYFLFVEVHPLDKFLIKHFIFFLGDLIMDFIQISGGTIPTLRHNFEVRFVRKGSHMEFPVMGIKESAR
jgi:hypothetical protein